MSTFQSPNSFGLLGPVRRARDPADGVDPRLRTGEEEEDRGPPARRGHGAGSSPSSRASSRRSVPASRSASGRPGTSTPWDHRRHLRGRQRISSRRRSNTLGSRRMKRLAMPCSAISVPRTAVTVARWRLALALPEVSRDHPLRELVLVEWLTSGLEDLVGGVTGSHRVPACTTRGDDVAPSGLLLTLRGAVPSDFELEHLSYLEVSDVEADGATAERLRDLRAEQRAERVLDGLDEGTRICRGPSGGLPTR